MPELEVPSSAVRLPFNACDDQLLDIVRTWVRVLSREDYICAFGLTAHESYYEWTPSLLRRVVEGYGLPEEHPEGPFKITSIETALDDINPRHEVKRFSQTGPNGALGEISFDLPLNGCWSDLTATFAIHRMDDGLIIALKEVHVF